MFYPAFVICREVSKYVWEFEYIEMIANKYYWLYSNCVGGLVTSLF